MALFESYERRIDKINSVLNSYGIASIEEAEKITKDAGLNVYDQVKKIQPICFENACWAYTCLLYTSGHRRQGKEPAGVGSGGQRKDGGAGGADRPHGDGPGPSGGH